MCILLDATEDNVEHLQTCWNKFKGDERRFPIRKKMQPYRKGYLQKLN